MTRSYGLYDDSFEARDHERRLNHGRPWGDQMQALQDLWEAGCQDLQVLCEVLDRPASGVLPKLVQQGFLEERQGRYFFNSKKGSVMDEKASAVTVEVVTRICGKDASTMSDAEIFGVIARAEGARAHLERIQAKSVKVDMEKQRITDQIALLVAYVDGRPDQ